MNRVFNSARRIAASLLALTVSLQLCPDASAQVEAIIAHPATVFTSTEAPVFKELLQRLETVEPPKFVLANVFTFASNVKEEEEKKGPVVPQGIDVEGLKTMFGAVRVSSVSITTRSKIAVIAYNNTSYRVHEGETVLGPVVVRRIEKDRVMFQYPGNPPIWIYRTRPGMPPPELVFDE